MESSIRDVDLEGKRDNTIANVDKVEDTRHLIVFWVIIGIVVLLVVQVLVAMLDTCARPACQPSHRCIVLQPIVTILFLLVMFLAWCVTWLLSCVAVPGPNTGCEQFGAVPTSWLSCSPTLARSRP